LYLTAGFSTSLRYGRNDEVMAGTKRKQISPLRFGQNDEVVVDAIEYEKQL